MGNLYARDRTMTKEVSESDKESTMIFQFFDDSKA